MSAPILVGSSELGLRQFASARVVARTGLRDSEGWSAFEWKWTSLTPERPPTSATDPWKWEAGQSQYLLNLRRKIPTTGRVVPAYIHQHSEKQHVLRSPARNVCNRWASESQSALRLRHCNAAGAREPIRVEQRGI